MLLDRFQIKIHLDIWSKCFRRKEPTTVRKRARFFLYAKILNCPQIDEKQVILQLKKKKKLLAAADHKLHMNQQYHAVPHSLNIYYVYIYIGMYKQENRLK